MTIRTILHIRLNRLNEQYRYFRDSIKIHYVYGNGFIKRNPVCSHNFTYQFSSSIFLNPFPFAHTASVLITDTNAELSISAIFLFNNILSLGEQNTLILVCCVFVYCPTIFSVLAPLLILIKIYSNKSFALSFVIIST